MKQSQLFFKTRKEVPSDADSINASYLVRAGFVHKHMAGVYAMLPLGYRVMTKIEKIVREEMDRIGGQEILMNVLQPRELWEETGRWLEASEIFYKVADDRGQGTILAPTHEEEVTDIVRKNISSYKDLPFALYQIQTKFRNEARAKSGLLRGREFVMKDMYSFSLDKTSHDEFYQKSIEAYFNIFKRLGLEAKIVEASGGIFSKYSHEFQVLTPVGEDEIYLCDSCDFAQNKEIVEVKAGEKCPKCDGKIYVERGIEVGNIFTLSNKFSTPMKAKVRTKDGGENDLFMGCYGIGITRSLATAVELHYDITKNKMVWPEQIAPFDLHLISLGQNEEAEKVYEKMKKESIDVLFDDRELSAGEKFAEADLVGVPRRIVISKKSLENGGGEVVDLRDNTSKITPLAEL
jgi:prolyl-tRNA synthetase